MTIPTLPAFYDMPYTEKDGKLTAEAHLHNDQTFQVLDSSVNLSNQMIDSTINAGNNVFNGIKNAQQTTAQITALQPNSAVGTVWFNTTLGKLQVKTAPGVVQTITST